MANNKSPTNFGVVSGATHKVLKPLKEFMPVPAPAPAVVKKKPVNTKPKAWVSLKGGKPGDDLKYATKTALDENDPNYDPTEAAAVPPSTFDDGDGEYDDGGEGEEEYDPAQPNVESQKQFVASIGDLDKFKSAAKVAVDEFLASADATEFEQSIKELGLPIYHQELAHIVIKHTLDKKDDERRKVTNLLVHAFKKLLVTENQILLGFTKLYNQLDDLCVDSPNARKVVAEHAERAVDFGILNAVAAKRLSESDTAVHGDAKTATGLKSKMKAAVREYFSAGDQGEAVTAVSDLKAPAFHFEYVKILISTALDQSDRHRELASLLLARLTGDVIEQTQVVKAFEILLQRVEDLYLDVRNVLHLLACFLARAVVDESVPPAFLLRQDLAVSDMGMRVVREASELLKGKGVAKRLEMVWKANEPKTAAAAKASSSPTSAAAPPVPATGTTGTAKLVEVGKKKAVLSLAPLPKGGSKPSSPTGGASATATAAAASPNSKQNESAAAPATTSASAASASSPSGKSAPAKPAASAPAWGPKKKT